MLRQTSGGEGEHGHVDVCTLMCGGFTSCLTTMAGGFVEEPEAAGRPLTVCGCAFGCSASSAGQAPSLEPDLPHLFCA